MTGFIAAIRRLPGGAFRKGPKSAAMPALPQQTSVMNLKTYFDSWPKRKAQFLLYGPSSRGFASSTAASPPMVHSNKEAMDEDALVDHLYGPAPTAPATAQPLAQQPQSDVAAAAAAVALAAAAKPLGLAGVTQRFKRGEKLTMVTAYDFPSARFARNAGVELVLVGDSLGNCRLGLPDTVGVTMEDMLRATVSVRRGVDAPLTSAPVLKGPSRSGPKPVIVGDMPFGSYLLEADALRNAAAFRMAGADMVKLEGGGHLATLVQSLTNAGIAVMGHIGLEPHRALLQGGLRLQGTTASDAMDIIKDAQALAAAGARAIVVECVPEEVAAAVQASVPGVPIIGIGAGRHVAGQVLVCDDMLGLHGQPPSFAKMFADVGRASTEAYACYVSEVRTGVFPGTAHARKMKTEELQKLQDMLPEEAASATLKLVVPPKDPQVSPQTSHTSLPVPNPLPAAFSAVAATWRRSLFPIPGGTACAASSAFELLPGGRLSALPSLLPHGSAAQLGARCLTQVSGPVVLRTRRELREWRQEAAVAGRRVSLVPTMGNLHEGHLELVHEAQKHSDDVLTTIFVNPAQFAAHEDLDKYPRTFEQDLDRLRLCGVAAIFAPKPEEIYPRGSPGATVVVPRFVDGKSEAAARPCHFTGVATVCLKLFNLCEPHVAVFGQKDAMQCAVIGRMLEDLMLNDRITFIISPTSREPDGLARSSRNSYLTPAMRAKAPAIYRSLMSATQASSATPGSVRAAVALELGRCGMTVGYVSVADAQTMDEKTDKELLSNSVVSVACLLQDGNAACRLIDNVLVPAVSA